ncbi:hypothetical protein ES319_D09G210400v1 [Gossypium barbadense]|uniref:Uncharacterized protein n=1 Tax=Gossypium barbadense TaxID=3634 RepID=A0A5J5QBE0_GOSBA|nr:hypothetical protein ES319_D09G210400v1 [Gossypium barbadense]
MARLQPRTNPHQFSNLQQPLHALPHFLLAQRIEIDKKKNSSSNSSHPSANWSPCSTAVASTITTDRTRKSHIDINFHPPLRRGHPFYHGSRFRMFQSQCATPIFHTKTPNEANKQSRTTCVEDSQSCRQCKHLLSVINLLKCKF